MPATEDPKEVRIEIKEQGAVRVSCAHIVHEADGIACISMVLHSKRVPTPMHCSPGDGHDPELRFMADEKSLHLDESRPAYSETIVTIPEYSGWQFFSVATPSKYTVAITLVR